MTPLASITVGQLAQRTADHEPAAIPRHGQVPDGEAGADRTASATVIPFAPRRRGGPEAAATAAVSDHRFTPSDRAALIALGYALAGWDVAFEEDSQGMQWAALCPPEGNGSARYVVGRDGGVLALLSASGEILGRYGTSAGLAQDVRRWEAASCGRLHRQDRATIAMLDLPHAAPRPGRTTTEERTCP